MSVIGSNILAGASGQAGYNLTNSLRFRSSASAYLNRTPASSSNRRTWTWSAWVKRSELSSNQSLFAVNDNGNDYQEFRFQDSNTLRLILDASANNYAVEVPTVVWRDVSAWYHIVLAVDTTQATSTNRVKIYVNGIQQTVSALSGFSFPAQNFDTYVNATLPHAIGNFNYNNSAYFNGYMTEINLIDGQALTPSSFGETSATTGVWIPKKYSGTYGTNGFYLPFTDNSALTTSSNVGLGKDFSGNGNYFATNNISITSGSTYDSMTDVPTLTSATVANYAVLNPLAMYGTNAVISNANLTSSATSTSNDRGWASTIAAPNSGKWYAEFTFTSTNGDNNGGCGIMLENGTGVPGESATTVSWRDFGTLRQNASGTSYGSALVANDVVIVAYDAALGRVWFGKNGTWFASGDPATNANPSATGITTTGRFATYHYNTVPVIQANFGQRPFAYTPPTGFKALNTFNLPTPTIGATASTLADDYFNTVLYSGNNSTQNIAVGFQPDWVWSKCRNVGRSHRLSDAVRGSTRDLYSDTTDDEENNGSITSFISTGFSLDNATGSAYNTSGENYVSWAWKANGAGSSNTAGSITSTVSANTSAGFSIVTYTGTGANATVGHGLGVAPKMIIVKRRDAVAAWDVYHASIGATGRLYLNTTDATNTSSAPWNDTAPTSSVFTVGTATDTNASGSTIVAYCFAQIAGYSAFGSYTGNGSTDGTFVYLGFRAKFLMLKCTTSGSTPWVMYDTSRNPSNAVTLKLAANNAEVENGASVGNTTENLPDINSNGFKMRSTNTSTNGSGETIIYMAFAENPFKYANAR